MSEVQKKFTSRVVSTQSSLKVSAMVLVTTPDPNKLKRQEAMLSTFNQFTKTIQFKQDRVMFFIASPDDIAIDLLYPQVTMQDYYHVDFSKIDLPALMLVHEQQVEFFSGEVTVDTLATWLFDKCFQDMVRF